MRPAYPQHLEIDLTPDAVDVVRLAVSAGRLAGPVQAVQEAMALWVDRERMRVELRTSLDLAEISISEGRGMRVTPEDMANLASDVMERCRARLDETPTPRA